MLLHHAQRFETQNPEYRTIKSAIEHKNLTPSVLEVKKLKKINKASLWIAKKVAKWKNKFANEGSGKNINGLWMLILGILSLAASVPLACALSCGGAEALAIVVLLIGLGNFVGGMYLIIKYGIKKESISKKDETLQTILLISGIAMVIGGIISLITNN